VSGTSGGDDPVILARTFFRQVCTYLYCFSSREWQEAVWVRGDHPKHFVQSYGLAVEEFNDFVRWLTADDMLTPVPWTLVPLTVDQVRRVQMYCERLNAFDDSVGLVVEDSTVLADPRWTRLVSEAGETLTALEGESGPIRNSFEAAGGAPT